MILLDASVIVAGLAGPPQGAAPLVLTAIRLGDLAGCTVENAMDEARRHLLDLFNRDRLKFSPARTDRELTNLRSASNFTVHGWINPDPDLWPENPKDAYLLAAIEAHQPEWLLTTDRAVLALGRYRETRIATPWDFIKETDM